ncbi:MAG: hypothetical protein E7813_25220 [Bradyrhizobium sp.]|uniref:hypothetical protein n=1 Tax=Bradyrhizobium sp. TaxID=376 RepID=UPI001203D023|nr:hypothetical protein [Bradyrhizobium sp.]THD59208.1 MAG: hypothetical protein E7813_25220 [Bradyrhizobium sp.]
MSGYKDRLVKLYRLSTDLMDKKLWDEAVEALDQTIELSEEMQDPFFLEESRFRTALCCKILGRQAEFLKQKQMISPDKTFFIEDRALGLKDLG